MKKKLSPSDEKALIEQVMLANERLWKILKDKDTKGFDSVFADEGLLLDFSGWWDKETFIQIMPDLEIVEYSLNDIKVIPITKKSAVITYLAFTKGSVKGHELAPYIYRSSILVRRAGEWKSVFHQATTQIQMDAASASGFLASFP